MLDLVVDSVRSTLGANEPPAAPFGVAGRASWLLSRVLREAHEARHPASRLSTVPGRARMLQRLSLDVCRSHAIEPTVVGAFPAGPCVIVANHLSYIEPIAISSIRACVPIAKGEVAEWPLIGSTMRQLGILFVRRGDASSGARVLKRALHVLRLGVPVLNFPEGTTTTGAGVGRFRRGVFGLARIARVPVVPVAVELESPELCWVGGAALLPHYLRTASRSTISLKLRVGRALDPSRFAHASALAEEARQRILATLSGSGHENSVLAAGRN